MIIGEVSAKSGVSARSLRHYEKLGLITSTRAANGYRHYDDDVVAKARTIRSIFDLGFSSETARVVLPCAGGSHEGVDRQAVTAHVERLRDELGVRMKELDETQKALTAFLEQA